MYKEKSKKKSNLLILLTTAFLLALSFLVMPRTDLSARASDDFDDLYVVNTSVRSELSSDGTGVFSSFYVYSLSIELYNDDNDDLEFYGFYIRLKTNDGIAVFEESVSRTILCETYARYDLDAVYIDPHGEIGVHSVFVKDSSGEIYELDFDSSAGPNSFLWTGISTSSLTVIVILVIVFILSIRRKNKKKNIAKSSEKRAENNTYVQKSTVQTQDPFPAYKHPVKPHTTQYRASGFTPQQEIKKVFLRCEYCHATVPDTEPKCTSCGAPLPRKF